MRSTARRTAAVLMMALMATLLVATGGSARTTPHRLSAGTTHTVTTPLAGRHATLTADTSPDKPAIHVDLASTPPRETSPVPRRTVDRAASGAATRITTDGVTALGRAPPAV